MKKPRTKIGEVELQLATLQQILCELRRRKYQFVFSCLAPHDNDNDIVQVHLGTDELVTPIRLSGEVMDCILTIFEKNKINNAATKILGSILLQLEVLFGEEFGGWDGDETTNQKK
jgi:hypothetical protein